MTEKIIHEYDELPTCAYDGKYRFVNVELIKYITARVRKTIEYKNFIEYMKKTMNINHCTFYKDYSMDKGFIIELHHAPLTLYDYVETLCNFYFSLDKEDPFIEPWMIEEHTNKLHYEFMVGLVPLNPTAHKLVHNGDLNIHPTMIEGNWSRFISEYSTHLSDEVKGKIEAFNILRLTDPNTIPDIIKYKPVLISNLKFKSLGTISIEKLIIDKLKLKFIEKQSSLGDL